MSYLFREDTQEARSQSLRVAQSYGVRDYGYSVASDLAAPFVGLAASINGAAMLAADAGTPILQRVVGKPLDDLFKTGGSVQEWLEGQRKRTHDAARNLVPDPLTSSVVGHAVAGLTEMLPQAVAGFVAGGPAGAAALVGGIQGNKAMQLAADQGVDPLTATGVGVIQGGTAAIGAVMPMHLAPYLTAGLGTGTRVATNIGFGAANQSAFGMASRGGTSELLAARGYPEMAAQYQAFDRNAILTDVVLGGAFGWFGHSMAVRAERQRNAPKPLIDNNDIDLALTGNLQHNVEVGTSPGLPTNVQARSAHVEALVKATEDLLAGDPVNVGAAVTRAEFLENPQATQARVEIGQVIADHVGTPILELGNTSVARLPAEVPNAIMGMETEIKIGDSYFPARYALVDAATMQATLGKADNQFRDRSRAASELQITKIAGAPDWNLLNASAIMDFGSPTMSRQGLIVGGNGRFEGVSRAYDQNTAGGYQAALEKNLQQFGFSPGAALNMRKPMLVRVLEADVDVKKAAIASNEGAGLQMSGLEQAKADAQRIGNLGQLRVGENGEILAGANDRLIRSWVAGMSETQAGTIVDRAGHLSQDGMRRLRNAVLYMAYGDSPALERLVDSLDPGARNVASALLKASATAAKARAEIEAGSLYPLDITPDLIAAADKLEQLRASGTKVGDYLSQGDMFGGDLSLEARKILQFFGDHMKSAKSMAELLTNYWARVDAVGDPRQAGLLGETAAPSRGQLLDAALAETRKVVPPPEAELPFGAPPPEVGGPRPADEAAQPGAADRTAQAVQAVDERTIVNDLDPGATPQEKVAQLQRMTAENKPVVDAFLARLDQEFGTESGSNVKAPENILSKAKRPSILEKKPWHDVEHIRDSFRFKTILDDLAQLPGIVDRLVSDLGATIIKADLDKVLSPKEYGWRIVAFDLKMPNGQLVEYYLPVRELEVAKKGGGHQLFEKVRNLDPDNAADRVVIEQVQAESRVFYQKAWDAYLARTGQDETAVRASLDSAKASAGEAVSYPSAKSPTLEAGAGERQVPSNPRTAEPQSSNTNATPEPSSATKAIAGIDEAPFDTIVRPAAGDVKSATPGPTDLFTQAVEQILRDKPGLRIMDENGEAVLARDLFARADEELAIAQRESQAYDVAVACALRG